MSWFMTDTVKNCEYQVLKMDDNMKCNQLIKIDDNGTRSVIFESKNRIDVFYRLIAVRCEDLGPSNSIEELSQPVKLWPSEMKLPTSRVSMCGICFEGLASRVFTDSCVHKFCKKCLQEWEKIKHECPVCRTEFKNIGIFPVEPISNEFKFDVPLTNWQQCTSDFRSYVYGIDIWVRSEILAEASENYREFTPEFYRANMESEVPRISFWLSRELFSLFHPKAEKQQTQIEFFTQVIIRYVLPRCSIRSEIFKKQIDCILKEKSDHFIHELYTFACSLLDTFDFDEYAVYYLNPSVKLDENTPSRINLYSELTPS